jgi:hypothetical protein
MKAIAGRAAQISERGYTMAQRGMLYAGRAEQIKALQLIAQAIDVQQGGSVHTAALASGLTALDEARDFAASSARPDAIVNVADITASHRTAMLKTHPAAASLSPVVAQQQYFGFAQAQLAIAAGGQPVASLTLYRLGRLQSVQAMIDTDPQALHTAQAMVFHQAALAVDSANHLAANELGVLLARYGQLDDARRVLLHSVSVHPVMEAWHNLAAVHRRLGEGDLASRAEKERDLVAKQTGSSAARTASAAVRWVDPSTFAASGGRDIPWPETLATAPARPAPPTERR